MRIGVITSGGDAPGMNPCIAGLAKNAEQLGHELFGFEYGYAGILQNKIRRIHANEVQGIYKMGGTILKTSRLPELKEPSVQKELIAVLKQNGIAGLAVLGGDGSFKGADALSRQDASINFVGIPATIDNNIYKSEYTLGFDTALNKQMAYIDDIMDTAASMPGRVFLVETLGAWDGYLAMSSVHMGIADFSVLVERPMTDDEIAKAAQKALSAHGFAVVTLAEGTYRMFETAKYVHEKLGCTVKCNLLGYQQRGGTPTALERLHAAAFAKYAVRALHDGIMNQYVVYSGGGYRYVNLSESVNKKEFNWFEL